MKAVTTLLEKLCSKLYRGIPLFILSVSILPKEVSAQISYSTSFDGCNAASCSNWTISGGNSPSITATTGNNYTPCNTASAKSNIYASATTTTLVSTASLGTSSGMSATLGFSYKCIRYTDGAGIAAGNCTFTAAWATAAGGPWTTISSINNINSTSCTATSFSAFTPTTGQPVFIRIIATRGGGDFWAVIDNITLTQAAATACSGTPTAGTASPATQNVAAGSTATITLSGATSASGLTYQWQESTTSGGTYTNVTGGTGATTASYTTAAVSANKYYRCIVSCGGASANSTVAEVVRQYCTPSSTNVNSYISNLTTTGGVTNINNSSTYTTGGYANYSATVSASQYPGSNIGFTITNAGSNLAFGVGLGAWVDWNDDGDFLDAGEQVYNSMAYVTGGSGACTLTVPSGQAAGNYRMRIIVDYNTGTPTPCTINTRGEAEDYTISVLALIPCTGTPNAGTAAISSATGCANINFTLSATGLTTGSGISLQWQSSPTGSGSWTNIASATSSTLLTSASTTTFYRLVTTCSNSSQSNNTNVVSYTVNCVTMPATGTASVTLCSGTLYEPGGTGNYTNNLNSTLTIYPSSAGNVVSLNFSSFATELGYDGLTIYNGNSTSAPIIASSLASGDLAANCPNGSYYGTTSPGLVTSTAADGSLTLVFRTDGSTVGAGFAAAISCAPPANYVASWISMSTGSSTWCAGETRNISVTVKNAGSSTWTNGSPDINIGVKWGTDASYTVKADANGLASGATQTYNFSLTAPSASGFNSLSFDVINEGNCNFSSNSGTCGPGNTAYSVLQTINAVSVANAGSDVTTSCGLPITINGVSTPTTSTLLKEDFENATTGVISPSLSNWGEVYFNGSGLTFWALNGYCPVSGSRSMTLFDYWNGTDCDYDAEDIIQLGAAYGSPIDATGYSNIKLNFKWRGTGQGTQDYAQVMYSFDGSLWTFLPTIYNGQSTVQSVSNLDLSVLNGQVFYIGFCWRNNDNSQGSAFAVDDILLVGDKVPTYSWSPTTNLSASNVINPVASPPSTTTYTLTASLNSCSSTDDVNVIVSGSTSAPTSVTGGGIVCVGNNATLTANGGTLVGGAVYEWFSGSCGTTPVGTGTSITVSPATTTTYYVRTSAVGSCAATACVNGTVTLPATGTTLSNNNESATCVVQENNYIHFYHSSGRLLASINSNGQNLGNVSVTSYLEGSPISVASCLDPTVTTATLARHWVITPQFQPATPVTLRLPLDNSAEFAPLASVANTNTNPNDDVSGLASIKLSKYSGPANVDSDFSNNCTGAGGSGGTTLLTQTGNGNVSDYVSGFTGDGKYIQFSVGGFSEFWLHGGSSASPLPVTLSSFSANCSAEGEIDVDWSTESESNSERFVVEKSRDLNTWSVAGELAASGNSNHHLDYSMTDHAVFDGVSYYRLVQYDHDGVSKTYEPISVSCNGTESGMIVFPNPSKGDFTVEIASEKAVKLAEIQLTDLAGKLISRRLADLQEGNNQVLFSGMELQMGTYMVRLIAAGVEVKPVRVVVN